MLSKILFGLLWLYSSLPLCVQYVFSDFYYLVLYYLLRYRRRVVRRNLTHAFPEKSLEELIQIEKKFYRHLCDVFKAFSRYFRKRAFSFTVQFMTFSKQPRINPY